MDYKGVIIVESLDNKDVFNDIRIVSTKVENVIEKHKTPWLLKWTLHTVEIQENKAEEIAEKISKSLECDHPWYADFKNKTHHYIIFRDKIFYIDRTSKKQYDAAKKYGISLGIPEYQVDFHPDIDEWKR